MAQFPELADELEEELKKMETENKEYQAQVDDLEQKVVEVKEKNRNGRTGTAFVSSEMDPSSNIDVGEEEASDFTISEEESADAIDDGATLTTDAEEDVVLDNHGIGEESTSNSSATDLESPDGSMRKVDLTLTNFIETLRTHLQHTQDDMKRLLELLIPVFQPLLNAGDVAWRQLKALFLSAISANQSPSDDDKPEDAA